MDYKNICYESCGDGWTAYKCYDEDAYEVDIPDEIDGKPVVQIESGAFQNMKNLESVWIGKNVTLIETEAFMECPNLKSVEIMSPEIEMDGFVFSHCKNLKRFYSVGIISLSTGVFAHCKKLEDFTGIIDVLGRRAFAHCESLKANITFAKEVFSFYGDAFDGKCGVTNLYFMGSINRLNNMAADRIREMVFHCYSDSSVRDLAYDGYKIVIQEVAA